MTKSEKTAASTKEKATAPPLPLNLVGYSNDDDEQTTPQGSQNSQDSMPEAVNTAVEKSISDSEADSDPKEKEKSDHDDNQTPEATPE
ncbi:hypothetical protein DY000_02053892 [Brassica cretica]|uniref:Uncharacterized protein n=1 Tax=Brassica cretica TaxID=69181 RepID=A0ABQ7ALY2_BRACR|nr:hypothetical protein DY000_02053892 [Brassica cretica]